MFSRKGFFVIPLRSLFCGMALFLVLIAGCSSGPKLVKANGQLLYNSKPLSVDPNTKISVFFVSMGEEAATFTADPFDRAVMMKRCEQVDAVITPAEPAREFRWENIALP